MNYPTAEFASYADCDMDFVYKQLPPGLVPFWTTDNISLASDYWDNFKVNESAMELLEWATLGVCVHKKLNLDFPLRLERLLVGGFMSDCKKPCLTTEVSITKRASSTQKLQYNSIYFAIPSKISTTNIKEDSFQLMESLNFLGSNLGLWPGLGLFQLFEGLIALIVALKLMNKLKYLLASPKQ